MLTPEIGQPPRVFECTAIRERRFDLTSAVKRFGESIAETQLSFPYFWRKRSTRPAVSISFCFPVKNGWH